MRSMKINVFFLLFICFMLSIQINGSENICDKNKKGGQNLMDVMMCGISMGGAVIGNGFISTVDGLVSTVDGAGQGFKAFTNVITGTKTHPATNTNSRNGKHSDSSVIIFPNEHFESDKNYRTSSRKPETRKTLHSTTTSTKMKINHLTTTTHNPLNVTLDSRSIFEVPLNCPEGERKDRHGNCRALS